MTINVFEGARRIAKIIALLWIAGVIAHTLFDEPFIAVTYTLSKPDANPVRNRPAIFDVDGAKKAGYSDTEIAEFLAGQKNFDLDNARKHYDDQEIIRYLAQSCDYWRDSKGRMTVKTPSGKEAHLGFCAKPGIADEYARWIVANKVKQGTPEFERAAHIYRAIQGNLETLVAREFGSKTEPIVAVRGTYPLPQSEADWIDSQWWTIRWKQIRDGAIVMFSGLAFLWILMWTIGWIVRGFLGIPRGQDRKPPEG